MSYLIDTSLIISFLNGRARAVDLFRSLPAEDIHISVVSCGETLEGLHQSETRVLEFTDFLDTITVVAVNIEVAQVYADERANLRSAGKLIPDNDLWIAATALTHDLTLVTNDQHFSRIPDLRLYSFD